MSSLSPYCRHPTPLQYRAKYSHLSCCSFLSFTRATVSCWARRAASSSLVVATIIMLKITLKMMVMVIWWTRIVMVKAMKTSMGISS